VVLELELAIQRTITEAGWQSPSRHVGELDNERVARAHLDSIGPTELIPVRVFYIVVDATVGRILRVRRGPGTE